MAQNFHLTQTQDVFVFKDEEPQEKIKTPHDLPPVIPDDSLFVISDSPAHKNEFLKPLEAYEEMFQFIKIVMGGRCLKADLQSPERNIKSDQYPRNLLVKAYNRLNIEAIMNYNLYFNDYKKENVFEFQKVL